MMDNIQAFTKLKTDIGKIINAKVDIFSELLVLAGLDPMEDLVGADLEGVDISSDNFNYANLRYVNLSNAELIGTNLSNANLESANLSRANLEDANLTGAKLYKANLRGARINNANLDFADLRYADLYKANLRGARINNANLDFADLRYANLHGTSLNSSSLNHTRIEGADFEKSYLAPILNAVESGMISDYGQSEKIRPPRSSLQEIEGIGEKFAAMLIKIGISNKETLLARGRAPQGRELISKSSGISQTLILEWVNLADLFRINGVGEEYSDLLEESGVDTVIELAQRNPANLYQAIVEVNKKKKLVRKLPNQRQVEEWINQAKKLPRIVEY